MNRFKNTLLVLACLVAGFAGSALEDSTAIAQVIETGRAKLVIPMTNNARQPGLHVEGDTTTGIRSNGVGVLEVVKNGAVINTLTDPISGSIANITTVDGGSDPDVWDKTGSGSILIDATGGGDLLLAASGHTGDFGIGQSGVSGDINLAGGEFDATMGGDIILNANGSGAVLILGTTTASLTTGGGGFIFPSVTQSNLPTASNGEMLYCSDCNPDATCTSGGSGAFAFRISGAWACELN